MATKEYKVVVQDGEQTWYDNDHLCMKVSQDGDKAYYHDGKLHREDGPAIESINGYKEWFWHGINHRADGPAIIWDDGSEQWIVQGKRHRLDGPAVIWKDGDRVGDCEWWVDDEQYTEQQFNEKFAPKELTIAQIEELLGYSIKVVK